MPDNEQPDVASVIGDPQTFSAFGGVKERPIEAPPSPPTTDFLRRQALGKVLKSDWADPLADLYQREEEVGRRVKLGEAKRDMDLAQRIAGAEGAYARGVRGAYAAAEPKLMAPQPKFNVSRDSAEGMNALAVLMPIAGMIIGSKGMMSGVNAMNAMAGALEGYQKGNKERIDFETKKYEKAVEEWKNAITQVKDSLARYEKLAATDLAAATSQAKAEAAAKGYGVVKDLIEQQGLTKTREIVERIATQTAQAQQKIQLGPIRAYDVLDGQGNRLRITEEELRQDLARPEAERQYRMAPTGREPTPLKAVMDGKTVYVDRNGQPITDKAGKPIIAPETRTAAAETRYSFNVAESMGQAIQDLKNVQLLPRDSVLGTFAGLTGADAKGMIDGLRNVFARNVTAEDNRLFEQMIGGLEANMARALGGGYASSTTAKNIEAYRSQVAREGDTPMAKAIFLARMRQELDTLADFFEQRPGAGPFVPTVKKYQELLHDAVPFTVDDVIRARSNVESLPIGAEGAAQRGAGGAPAPAQMNTAEDVKSAFKAGRISREEATRILKEKFGYQ